MAVITYKNHASNPISVLSTGLNSLGTGAAALSSAVANASDGYRFGMFALTCGFVANPSADQTVEVWIIQSTDGSSTYEDGSTTGPITGQYLAHLFTVRAATSLARVSPLIAIPPYDFKVLLVNKSGQTMSASGNTLTLFKVTEQTT